MKTLFIWSILGGLLLGLGWLFFENLFWLNFFGLSFLFYWQNSNLPLHQKIIPAFVFLVLWFSIGGVWLQAYQSGYYLFGVSFYTFLYLLLFLFSFFISKFLPKKFKMLSVFAFWVALEYLQDHYPPFVPWFNLGNGFAGSSIFNPIYPLFGTSGVSLVILFVGFLLFKSTNTILSKQSKAQWHWLWLVVFVPIYFIELDFQKGKVHEFVLLQPQKTPHKNNDYDGLLETIKKEKTEDLLVLAPESFFDETVNDDEKQFQNFMKELKQNDLKFLGGFIQKKPYQNKIIDENITTRYLKHKLVPMVETNLFSASKNKLTNSMAVCSESCYSSVFQENNISTEDFFYVFSNEIWFEKTSAFKHHTLMLKNRALEIGKTIVKVGNSGQSGVFYPNGKFELFQNDETLIRQKIEPLASSTLFNKNGDILGRLALLIAPFLVLYAIVRNRIL